MSSEMAVFTESSHFTQTGHLRNLCSVGIYKTSKEWNMNVWVISPNHRFSPGLDIQIKKLLSILSGSLLKSFHLLNSTRETLHRCIEKMSCDTTFSTSTLKTLL